MKIDFAVASNVARNPCASTTAQLACPCVFLFMRGEELYVGDQFCNLQNPIHKEGRMRKMSAKKDEAIKLAVRRLRQERRTETEIARELREQGFDVRRVRNALFVSGCW